jgi:hypothetical protein
MVVFVSINKINQCGGVAVVLVTMLPNHPQQFQNLKVCYLKKITTYVLNSTPQRKLLRNHALCTEREV